MLRNMLRSFLPHTKLIQNRAPVSEVRFFTSFNKGVDSSSSQNDEYVEDVVCKVSDIPENEMRSFDLAEEKVLVIKQNGTISALGAKCTHYGAPLVNGALGDGRVRCQWHGACFNILNGDIEDFPGMDSLPCYQVTIEDDNVKVRAKKSELSSNKRIKSMAKVKRVGCEEKIIVIGGGPSGATCVETLRQEGFQGQITMVCKENYLPYDRIKVSKQMNFEIEKAQFRNDAFYKENGINIIKGSAAASVDTASNTVRLCNGTELKYDKLYVATGSSPKKPNCPGGNLKNVCVLLNYDDAAYAYSKLTPETDVVVVGSSFVGMEAANFCVDKVKSVTVIGRSAYPFRTWGQRIGSAILKMFEDKGVKFIPNNGIKTITSNGQGEVASVELTDGQVLKCDILFSGIGSASVTDFLKGSGIEIMPNGSIETNEYLQSNIPNVYIGGDIAYAPVWSYGNKKVAIGHFGLAQYHGRMAAINMTGQQKPLRTVPYFFTMLFGKGFRYAGHGSYDDIIYAGDVEGLKFMAFFMQGDEAVAAVSCGMDPLVSKFAERLAQEKKLYRRDLIEEPLAWTNS